MILHVKKLNNGQSEVWLNEEPRQTVATNAIRNAFLAVGDSEQTRAFAARYLQIDEEASVDGPKVAEIATELGLVDGKPTCRYKSCASHTDSKWSTSKHGHTCMGQENRSIESYHRTSRFACGSRWRIANQGNW